jgi:rod shape-determining protein MreB and related proteins
MDQAIMAFVKKEYSLMLRERTADEIKMAIGKACPAPQEPHLEIRGRDLISGLRNTVSISGGEVRRAIAEPVSAVVDLVQTALAKCPPELLGDVMDRPSP